MQDKSFWVASTPCQPKFSFSFTSTQQLFSAGLLSNQPFLPQAVLILGVPWPRCRTLQLALQNLRMFPWTLSLSRSLCLASDSPDMSAPPRSFMSSANLLRVCLMPLCDWWTSQNSPSTEPWGNTTCHHLSSGYIIIVYYLLCVIIQQIPYPLKSAHQIHISPVQRGGWGTMSKSLQKLG